MGDQRTIEVSISEEVAAKLDAVLDAGEYRTLSDLISDMLDEWSFSQAEDSERVRVLIEEGLSSGEPIDGPFDLEDIRRRGMERLEQEGLI